MDFVFFTPWHDVLPREAGHVVACAGGAGRVALLDAVAGVYAAEGVAVARCACGAADPGDGAVVIADAGGPQADALPSADALVRWPPRTSLAVLEVAAAVVGGRADAAYGAGTLPADLEPWIVLEWEHLEQAAAAAGAGLPPDVPVVLALTGLQEQPDSIGLFAFTGRMMARPELAVVLFCSEGAEGLAVRACCRAGQG
ncbi:MAG: hypothetical protein ABR506_10075 [Candidatus Krumholzibacteriia bacterium]